jgi:predicted ATP-binding protein involved in virulence
LYWSALDTEHRPEIDRQATEILKRELKRKEPNPVIVHRIVYWLEGAQQSGTTKHEDALNLLREFVEDQRFKNVENFKSTISWAEAALNNVTKSPKK